ncbi:uncharacterized protein A1O5_03569 [Cladophialophora psammophila CBS 110553]|uniref:Uncharacterized protein n=1 Tax=Cladophialophora psammophila CBS 110553 TaxID=1182543 RepID=W9X014_9EURO|nr:uncharacterized protein A1O5_03569 [Cladophialophora psammophila CBS 110553]EXJ73807.1 hypothetical protein A1O5_03569 [Cladophialophora psammophila CBS 110553]
MVKFLSSIHNLEPPNRGIESGCINIDIRRSNTANSDRLFPLVQSQLEQTVDVGGEFSERSCQPPLQLNIVIQIVGSRGDVQPFVALGKVLREVHGHRVRIATHAVFKSFVEEQGLEFFSIGGNPEALMRFMVNNPGLLPHYQSLRSGEVLKQRKCLYEVLKGCWRSCIEAGDGMGPRPTNEDYASLPKWSSTPANTRPFVADVIIANPPSFAHVHCAERLGVPLHLMFTMPWTPTQAFPHPLAIIRSSSLDKGLANLLSYTLVNRVVWHGLGDVINLFRQRCLHLEPLSMIWASGITHSHDIPFTYAWSPALLPKPPDWGPNVSVAGYFQLPPLESPPKVPGRLLEFLAAGPPPIYVGFGSIVVKDPERMTQIIFEAVAEAGVRALVSVGWAGLGGGEIPKNVHIISDIPHSWLFDQVSAVVHHGGAGTTAASLMAGKPTVIVPFFGDQFFWGKIVAQAGAGPPPVPYKTLTTKRLATAITQALLPSTVATAQRLSERIRAEHGSETGAEIFQAKLPASKLRCSILTRRAAVWKVKKTQIRLSALCAATLVKERILHKQDLELYRSQEYELEQGPWGPISGTVSTLVSTVGRLTQEFVELPINIVQTFQSPKPEPIGPCDSLSQASSCPLPTCSAPPNLVSLNDKALRPLDSRTSYVAELLQRRTLNKQLEADLCGSLKRRAPSRHDRRGRQVLQKGKSKELLQTMADISVDITSNVVSSLTNIADLCLMFPAKLTMSLALGFHNAPKLYGDKTVRPPPSTRVSTFKHGLGHGAREFQTQLSDAVTGVLLLPLHGAREDGFVGFTKGLGMGAGGLGLKSMAAIFGLPAYTLKGLHKGLRKHDILDFTRYIDAARTAQGEEEWNRATDAEKKEIIRRWNEIAPKS